LSRLEPYALFLLFAATSSGTEAQIILYDANQRKEKFAIVTSYPDPLECLQFNMDGSLIACAAEDGLVINVLNRPFLCYFLLTH
jgi:hypothetical protein